jgi:uncharacterized protein (UPF0212 family)
MKRTDTKTLIEAARVLARDIHSDDGVANAALVEIADRLEELKEDELYGLSNMVRNICENRGWDSRAKIEAAVLSGELHPRAKPKVRWYGKISHAEVCQWLGVNSCPHCNRPIK